MLQLYCRFQETRSGVPNSGDKLQHRDNFGDKFQSPLTYRGNFRRPVTLIGGDGGAARGAKGRQQRKQTNDTRQLGAEGLLYSSVYCWYVGHFYKRELMPECTKLGK